MRILALFTLLIAYPAFAQVDPEVLPYIESGITAHVFPNNADRVIACDWDANQCVPWSRFLDFAPPKQAPSLNACASGQADLRSCYEGAVTRLQSALESGSVLGALDAAYRTADVLARAQNDDNAPSWLQSLGLQNRLGRAFFDHGVNLLDGLGNCRSGSPNARYRCIGKSEGGVSPSSFRGLLALLDAYNDAQVVAGDTSGAAGRLLSILNGATAPMIVAMADFEGFDPDLGQGPQRIDLLGKHLFLESISGGLPVDPDTALSELQSWRGHAPNGQAALAPTAALLRFAAFRGAARWDPEAKKRVVRSPLLEHDVKRLVEDLHWARTLHVLRGEELEMVAIRRIEFDLLAPLHAHKFDHILEAHIFLGFGETSSDALITEFGGYGDPCGWFDIEDVWTTQMIYWTEEYTNEVTILVPEWVWIDGILTVSWTEETTEITWTEIHTDTIEVYLGQKVLVESMRDLYRALLDADDGDFVDVDDNGIADLNHTGSALDAASMAAGGIRANACLDELETLSGAYGHAVDEAECVGGTNCKEDYGAGADAYLPYALATRTCSDKTAESVGLYAPLTSGHYRSPTSFQFHAGHLPFEQLCTTPWAYVNVVADFMDDPDLSELRAAMDDADADGIGGLLADFATEALILTVPAAGMFRQRADLAYFGGDWLADCNDTDYGDCNGLDVLEARLEEAHEAIDDGLRVFLEFAQVDHTAEGLIGAEAIPEFAVEGLSACGACAPNSRDELRALLYKRLRDGLVIYTGVQSDRFELHWRRIDEMDASCLEKQDLDGDTVIDSVVCLAAEPDCTDHCADFDAAAEVLDETHERVDEIIEVLSQHASVLGGLGPDGVTLEGFVTDVAAYLEAALDGLDADYQALLDGVDWLGDRAGRWRVQPDDDAGSQVDALLAEIEAEAAVFQGTYNGYVQWYFESISRETDFASAVVATVAASNNAVADYCADASGEAAPDGCGVGDTWTSSNTVAQSVNDTIDADLCGLSKEIDGIVELLGIDGLDPTDPYFDFTSAYGLSDCPVIVSPDIASIQENYTGHLVEELEGMRRAMLDLQFAIVDFKAYVQMLEDIDSLIESYTDYFGTWSAQESTRKVITNLVVCGAEFLGATAATVGTGGGGAGTFIAAGVDCAQRWASDPELLFPEKNISAADLDFAGWYTNMSINQVDQIYGLTAKMQAIFLALADYQTAALSYRSAVAAFEREIAYGDTTFDSLISYQPWMDSTWILFENQQLSNLKNDFKTFAGIVQDAHRLIEYDMGNPVPQGQLYDRAVGEGYYVPKLSRVTLLSTHGAAFTSAYNQLESSAEDGIDVEVTDPGAFNLVSMASLLVKIYDDFRLVYADRSEATAYIGGDLPGVDSFDNPGERAMLGDSRFYDASQAGRGCAIDEVDLFDYCDAWQDVVGAPADDTCVDISLMSAAERLDLAWMDHMLIVDGVDGFECNFNGGNPTIAVGSGSGTAGEFTATDLGLAPASGPWFEGIENGIRQDYYDAQTPVVQALLDRYFAAVAESDSSLPAGTIKLHPGSFMVLVDMSSVDLGTGSTNDAFDPEADLLNNGAAPDATMAEQIEAISLVCTGVHTCGSPGSQHYAGLVIFGDGLQGTRCRTSEFTYTDDMGIVDYVLSYASFGGSARQEQLTWRMDHTVALESADWTYASTNPDIPDVDAILAEPLFSSVGNRPLHADSMLVVIGGVRDAAGNPTAGQWDLYNSPTDASPRVRLKLRYSYYSTDPTEEAASIAIGDFLPCGHPELSEVIE